MEFFFFFVKRGGGAWFSTLGLRVIRTGEWSEDRSKQDVGKAEERFITYVDEMGSGAVIYIFRVS
jgi:hypothetical protein